MWVLDVWLYYHNEGIVKEFMHTLYDQTHLYMVSLHEDTYIPYIYCGELLACAYEPFETEARRIHEGFMDIAIRTPAKVARWPKSRQSCLLG